MTNITDADVLGWLRGVDGASGGLGSSPTARAALEIIERQQAEITRLREGLDRYAGHDEGCEQEPWHGKGPARCSCGFCAVLEQDGNRK
jgi:hypothetical protein